MAIYYKYQDLQLIRDVLYNLDSRVGNVADPDITFSELEQEIIHKLWEFANSYLPYKERDNNLDESMKERYKSIRHKIRIMDALYGPTTGETNG